MLLWKKRGKTSTNQC